MLNGIKLTPETNHLAREWLAEQFCKLQLDIARAARKEWLSAEPWVREQILREEKTDAENEVDR